MAFHLAETGWARTQEHLDPGANMHFRQEDLSKTLVGIFFLMLREYLGIVLVF
jgi:hypothetical protein